MDCYNSIADQLVNTFDNSRLSRAIRLNNRMDNTRSRELLFYALCESSVIVLTGESPVHPNAIPSATNQRGFSTYEPGTNIALALFAIDGGPLVLPAFSDAQAVRRFAMSEPHALLMSGPQAMELMLATAATFFSLNPHSNDTVDLPRETVAFLVQTLKAGGALPDAPCVECIDSHFS